MPCMKKRTAAELRSYGSAVSFALQPCSYCMDCTGWAENSIKSWLKTLPHTIAASYSVSASCAFATVL